MEDHIANIITKAMTKMQFGDVLSKLGIVNNYAPA